VLQICLSDFVQLIRGLRQGVPHHQRVHRLLAIAFIPNPENKPQVDHVDGDKLNYSLSNLRWAFQGENNRYARDSKVWPEVIDMITQSESGADSHLMRRLTEDFRIKKRKLYVDRPPIKGKAKKTKLASLH
jgi:hypothetical protein